jgi:transposase
MKSRKKCDAAFEATIALEALREDATTPQMAKRHGVHGARREWVWRRRGEREREAAKLYARIGQLTVERDFLARRSGR